MSIMNNKLSIKRTKYDQFIKDYKKGKFGSKRLGEAFYDTFGLSKVVSTTFNIHAKDGQAAINCIKDNWKFN